MQVPRHFRPRIISVALAATLAIASAISALAEKKKPAPPLDRFYIVTQSVAPPPDSDATNARAQESNPLPPWTDEILDVAPISGAASVRVRKIEIIPAGTKCSPHAVIVRAAERTAASASVQSIAGRQHICALNESDVSGVIDAALRDEVQRAHRDDLANQTIVAFCGGKEELFELPYPDTLHFHALGLADPHITALWKLSAEAESNAFGHAIDFAHMPPDEDAASQQLAATLVPEIRSGAYDSGFADSDCPYATCRDHSARSALQAYSGPLTCASH
jgi:hypothetical protein